MESQILVDVKPKPALPGMPKIRRPGEDSSRSWCWVFDLKAGPLNTWESGRFPSKKYNECRKYIVYGIVCPLKRMGFLSHWSWRTDLGGSVIYCSGFFFVCSRGKCSCCESYRAFVLVRLSTFMITVNRNSTCHVAWGDSCEFVELLDRFSGGSWCSETRGGRTPCPTNMELDASMHFDLPPFCWCFNNLFTWYHEVWS